MAKSFLLNLYYKEPLTSYYEYTLARRKAAWRLSTMRWEHYTYERRAPMIFNVDHHQEDEPQAAEQRLWEGVI